MAKVKRKRNSCSISLSTLNYNQSTIQPENVEEPILVEAEKLYEKMLENITNKVIVNWSNDISFVSSFAQKESSEQNSDVKRTFAKEERNMISLLSNMIDIILPSDKQYTFLLFKK